MTSVLDGALPLRFGRYILEELLGQGGMGRVYRASLLGPAGFRKAVALKVLRQHPTMDDDDARRSLVDEARLGALLSHPHLVGIYDLGFVAEDVFVAMELVPGVDLKQLEPRS